MRKDFVNEVAMHNKIERADLVEKDLILHQILTDLSKNEFFFHNFAFKGGTCLTKCYLGHYRFSEDIDFTWIDQAVFEGKSQTRIRNILSEIIDKIGMIFEEIAKKRTFDFRCEKRNKHYVELGGSNKMCTFKLWYYSELLNRESFTKVQMNFVEKLYFPTHKKELGTLTSKESDELVFLFPEYKEYLQTVIFNVYDIREIFCEKVRSILTREGYKARDFLDAYLICKEHKIVFEDMLEPIVGKTRLVLDTYEKYRENFAKKAILLDEPFMWGEEKGLLLKEIDEKEFSEFLEKFRLFLKKVVDQLAASNSLEA
jgi:predicted nucleotidyltransferase component of viral defense system